MNKIKIRSIIESGAPVNIVSTQMLKKLKLAPNLEHNKEYGTAGPNLAQAQEAYSAFLMRFGLLQVLPRYSTSIFTVQCIDRNEVHKEI